MKFGNFAKTQGIWFAQVVNSLILKVKRILRYLPREFPFFFQKLDRSQIMYIGTGQICGGTGKKLGKHREFENTI